MIFKEIADSRKKKITLKIIKRTPAMRKRLKLNYKDNLSKDNLARNKKGGYNKNLR